jgi:LacI family transcriptional regulator/LacI family purine nucleotide synthesis repressor
MPEKNKVTMDDIANRLEISKNAVSIALGNKKGVSDSLREKVLDTARQMNYGKHALTNKKTSCVVSIVPEYIHNDTYFYSDIFWSIEKEAKKRDCISIMSGISTSAEKDLVLPHIPPEMETKGFLVIGIISKAYIDKILGTGLPVISVDITYPDTPVRSISASNLPGGYTATKYLIDKGHKKIGFIGPIYTAQSVYERWCGFCQAMDVSGLETNPGYNIVGNKNEFMLFDTIEKLESLFNEVSSYPTAWFCAGDRIAIALTNILTRRGVKIPQDVSIIGFDDIPMSQLVLPTLTTMRIDRKLMGKLALDALVNSKHDYRQNISIAVNLIERDSVKGI